MSTRNRPTVHIRMKPFLKAFVVSVYGPQPVFFPKRDKLNDLLQLLLAKPPSSIKPIKPAERSGYLEVILPYFENLNINVYNHLSENSQAAFEKRIKSRFWVTFEDFMDEAFRHGLQKNDAITLFMEKYDLPFDSYIEDMLRKAIYRSRRIQQKYPKRQYRYRKKMLSDKQTKKNNM